MQDDSIVATNNCPGMRNEVHDTSLLIASWTGAAPQHVIVYKCNIISLREIME
jgi:hypothetical protein